jgi:hypothetical protein
MNSPWLVRAALIVSLLTTATAWAQEPAPPAEPMPPMPVAPEGNAGEAAKPPPLREQTIYIPFTKLRAMFEKDGRGVFVPYEQVQALWKAAREAGLKLEDYKPPIGALIAQIDSTATVGRYVMNVEAKVSIEVLTEGWHEIPLRLADSAIRSAKIGDAPARIIYSPEAGSFVRFNDSSIYSGTLPEIIGVHDEVLLSCSHKPTS